MAENATPTPEPTVEAAPAASSSPTVPPAIALWLEVAAAATTKGTAVRELVVTELTGQEIVRRKDAVIVLLGKYDEKAKELKKSEKTLAKIEYDSEGKEVRKYYDAEGNKALKALRDELTSLSTALNNFFEKNDTSKLYELSKK